MHAFAREIRLTLRRLIRDPTLAVIAVIAFALGIGLTASMYSIAYSVLFRGLSVRDSEALVFLSLTDQETGEYDRRNPFLDYLDWRERQTTFTDLGAYRTLSVNLADDADRPERVPAAYVTPNLFPTLGVSPVLGRGLGDSELGSGHPVVLISDALWRNRYASDPEILGRTIRTDGERFTIIGIMPPEFDFPEQQQLWFPFPWELGSVARGEGVVWVVGRLRPGVNSTAAETEMNAIVADLARAYADRRADLDA